jgi:hypothetical protein
MVYLINLGLIKGSGTGAEAGVYTDEGATSFSSMTPSTRSARSSRARFATVALR